MKTKLNAKRKKEDLRRSHIALPETMPEFHPVSHSYMAIHRLMEMSLIKMQELSNKKLELMRQAAI